MLVSIQSTNANEYNKVSVNLDIPWTCRYVKYFVSSISTMSNIMICTTDDYFETNYTKTFQPLLSKHNFPKDKFSYTIKELENDLNEMSWFKWEYNKDTRTFKIIATSRLVMKSISHRAALLTGLYNTPMPLEIEMNSEYIIKDMPILNIRFSSFTFFTFLIFKSERLRSQRFEFFCFHFVINCRVMFLKCLG